MKAFFLPGAGGSRFCVYHPPAAAAARAAALLFVPAFAEEMNKSRHVVAQAARELAAAGYGVLLLDLAGCGDSTGSFADARWETWRGDVESAACWLREQGHARLILWGMRLGAMLAAEVAGAAAFDRCLLWQPVISGETFLVQFLRLRLAGAIVAGGKRGESVNELRSRLDGGEVLEVAGYPLAPELARAVAALRLERTPPHCPVHWIEVAADAVAGAAPASKRVVEAWSEQGVNARLDAVQGSSFWGAANTLELVQCPELVRATVAAVRSWA